MLKMLRVLNEDDNVAMLKQNHAQAAVESFVLLIQQRV